MNKHAEFLKLAAMDCGYLSTEHKSLLEAAAEIERLEGRCAELATVVCRDVDHLAALEDDKQRLESRVKELEAVVVEAGKGFLEIRNGLGQALSHLNELKKGQE